MSPSPRARSHNDSASLPSWFARLLRVPLIAKIAGANAIIVVAAILVALFGRMMGNGSSLWLLLLIALGLGMTVNAVLVYVALRPLKELERTARRVWQGELDARVPSSPVADAGIQRVANTLNILLDGLSADQARLRALANQVIQAGDRERATLARELHDSTAQMLAALLLELSVLATDNADPRLDDRITRVRAIVSDVLEEVRLLAHTVHPRVLDDLGLVAALQLLARESSERSNVSVTYAGPAKADQLDAAGASALYRVAQEAVGNAIRHARASSVALQIRESVADVELTVTDDGIGFTADDGERASAGMGLFTMRERAALVGGRLIIKSTEGKGTRVVAVVPRIAASPAPVAAAGAGNSWQRKESV